MKYILLFFVIVILDNDKVFAQGLDYPVYSYTYVFNSSNTDPKILSELDSLDRNWYCIEDKENYILGIRDQLSDKKQIQFLNILNVYAANRKFEYKKANGYLQLIKNDSILYLPGRFNYAAAQVSGQTLNVAKSIEYANKAISFFEESGFEKGLIQTYRSLILNYVAIDEIEVATEFFSKSILLCERNKYNIGFAMIYLAYARSVVAIDHEYAFELYRKAYEIIKKEQSEYWYIKVVTEYLRYFLRYGDRNSFENLYSEFMNRIENENICTYSLLSIIKTFQAHHYGQINNFDSAIFYNRQALELRKKDENSRLIGFSYLNLFSNYINNNKLDSAKLWLDSARNELFVKGNLKSKRHFIEYKIKMFQTQNLKDSVLNNYKLLLQIEKDYHLEQQRTQAQILKAKNEINNKLQAEKYHLQITKKQNRLIYVSIITVLSLIIIVYLLFKIKSKNIRFKNLYLVSKLDKSALQKYSKEVEQLKNIFKNANKGFFILDKQLKIDYYNTAAIDLFDNFHEGQNKISFLKYVPRNQQSIFENVIAKVTSINENQEIQLNIPDKKGEIRTFNISISPMHVNNDIESFLLIISDVTRASIAFESEKKQRRILQSLINSVSESIILIGANRKIQLLNSTAAARLGSVVEDLIDADYLESIPFHTREVREKKLSEVIETGKMVVFNEEKESYNYLISYYPSTNPEGMVEFVAEFSQDITERRLATEHINSLRQKVLRSQMNPHFIFNSLNAIQSYVLKNDAPQAVKYLNSFARLIRMILDSSRYDYITLAKEIKILEYYLELQQLRFGDKFIYQLEIDKNLDIEGLLIPAMLAQPFIENSIEHGLQHLEDKGKVKISFVKVKNSVVFKVVDNGIGREASYKIQEKIQHKDTSLSTQLFKERLYTLNKFSGKKITYNIVDLKDDAGVAKGTMVIINLPLIYKSDLNHN